MVKRILLVEDEEDTREAVSEFLSEAGYHVDTARDGEIAMKLLRNNIYDMVVLDIMLPKVNGFVVLNWLRKRSQIPVLMLTAMHDEYTQLMSFDEQADDYIIKPFSLRLLLKRMEALFRRSRAQTSTNLWQYQDIEVDFNGFCAYV
ncbi:MAG: response regulator transcription factor, partial [Clostridium sp.]